MLYCDSYFTPYMPISLCVMVWCCITVLIDDYEYGKSVFFDTRRWTPAERSDECFLKRALLVCICVYFYRRFWPPLWSYDDRILSERPRWDSTPLTLPRSAWRYLWLKWQSENWSQPSGICFTITLKHTHLHQEHWPYSNPLCHHWTNDHSTRGPTSLCRFRSGFC